MHYLCHHEDSSRELREQSEAETETRTWEECVADLDPQFRVPRTLKFIHWPAPVSPAPATAPTGRGTVPGVL